MNAASGVFIEHRCDHSVINHVSGLVEARDPLNQTLKSFGPWRFSQSPHLIGELVALWGLWLGCTQGPTQFVRYNSEDEN